MTGEKPRRWNLVWIVVDGIRRYPCADHEMGLGRLPAMDRFAERAIEFTNVVTAAPSTIMSLSSMLTSVPSYLLSRSFEAFRYDPQEFQNLGSLLADAGYERLAVSFYREARRYFREILKPVPSRYLPSTARSWMHWDGETVEAAAMAVLRSGLPEPAFLFIHLNGRRDPVVSARVDRLLDEMERRGLFKRSVVILCSDHGFPDPQRESFHQLIKRRGALYNRHDLILTDDNVLVPFMLWYPGCRPRKIDETISTLDIAPTVLDLLGLPEQRRRLMDEGAPRAEGRSAIGLLLDGGGGRAEAAFDAAGSERVVRIDARYLAQDHRVSGLRGRRYKYVLYHDQDGSSREEFYDLRRDPGETRNLVGEEDPEIRDALDRYRQLFRESEEAAVAYQHSYLVQRFKSQLGAALGSHGLDQLHGVVCFVDPRARPAQLMEAAIREGLSALQLSFTLADPRVEGGRGLNFWLRMLGARAGNWLVLLVRDGIGSPWRFTDRLLLALTAWGQPRFYVDINMDFDRATVARSIRRLWYRFCDRRELYRGSPLLLARDLRRLLRGQVHG